MTKHMGGGAAQQALCYFYRNPIASSGVKPQPYKEIAKLIQQPRTSVRTIQKVVQKFHRVRKVRGRQPGWRKTTAAEDAKILACFRKIRCPLGSLVESLDVWKALPATLRDKVTARTVCTASPACRSALERQQWGIITADDGAGYIRSKKEGTFGYIRVHSGTFGYIRASAPLFRTLQTPTKTSESWDPLCPLRVHSPQPPIPFIILKGGNWSFGGVPSPPRRCLLEIYQATGWYLVARC